MADYGYSNGSSEDEASSGKRMILRYRAEIAKTRSRVVERYGQKEIVTTFGGNKKYRRQQRKARRRYEDASGYSSDEAAPSPLPGPKRPEMNSKINKDDLSGFGPERSYEVDILLRAAFPPRSSRINGGELGGPIPVSICLSDKVEVISVFASNFIAICIMILYMLL
jgi:hypothetical protein